MTRADMLELAARLIESMEAATEKIARNVR